MIAGLVASLVDAGLWATVTELTNYHVGIVAGLFALAGCRFGECPTANSTQSRAA